MKKTKNTLIFGLIICTAFMVGFLYWNSIRMEATPDDEVVFIGEPPRFFYMATPNTDGNIFVAWYQVENAMSYDLYRNIDGGSYELIAQKYHNPSLRFEYIFDRDLTNGKYGYKIKSIYVDGESDFSLPKFVDVQLI